MHESFGVVTTNRWKSGRKRRHENNDFMIAEMGRGRGLGREGRSLTCGNGATRAESFKEGKGIGIKVVHEVGSSMQDRVKVASSLHEDSTKDASLSSLHKD